MAVIQKLVCDRHLNLPDSEEVEAKAGTMQLSLNKKIMLMELCPDCVAELESVLEPFFAAGRRPNKEIPTVRPADKDAAADAVVDGRAGPMKFGPFMCRWPDGECDRQKDGLGFDKPQGRAAHERGAHKYNAVKAASTLSRDAYGYGDNKDKASPAKKAAARKNPRRTREFIESQTEFATTTTG